MQDHLGNIRVVFQKQNATTYIAQQIDYGPGGDILTNSGSGPNLLTHLFQGKEWLDDFGYDFITRTYDPYTLRMLQLDGANQFASGYIGMGNNAVNGVDPDGQTVQILAGAAIGGFVNLLGQSMQGNVNNFKQGAIAFGMGAIAGGIAAATGGASLTTDQFIIQSIVGQVPGPNVNLGRGFSASISPALMMRTQGFSLGANVGIGFVSGNFSAGISAGAAFGKSSITGVKGWNGRLGGGIAFDNGKFYGSLSSMQYWSGETSQRTGTFGLGGGGFKVHYENDYHVAGLTDKLHISDAGDRYRTAALQASYGDLSIGFNLFTGDPGPPGDRPSSEINGKITYDGGDGKYSPDKYRLGGLYAGYKNIKFGRNSEQIRKVIQNRFAHDIMTQGDSKWFKILNISPSWYGNIGSQNSFSLW
jgi:Bacterial toxin 23